MFAEENQLERFKEPITEIFFPRYCANTPYIKCASAYPVQKADRYNDILLYHGYCVM